MRPQTNSDTKRYDRQDEIVSCPECRAWMLTLEEYELCKASESPDMNADGFEFAVWGWGAYIVNYFYDLFTYEGRKKKLAQQKREVLPQFPKSLVCPRCLHITKRS